jgi:hypothetical protein
MAFHCLDPHLNFIGKRITIWGIRVNLNNLNVNAT